MSLVDHIKNSAILKQSTTTAPLTTTPGGSTNVLVEEGGVTKRVDINTFGAVFGLFANNTTTLQLLDVVTQSEYTAAVAGASLGVKRAAAAAALVAAFSPGHRLNIYRGSTLVIPAVYTGNAVVTSDSTDVYVQLGTLASASPIVTADINTGVWTFEVQGGASYLRKIVGTVGPTGSGAALILSVSPTSGMGFSSPVKFKLPRSLDGLN